MANLPHGIQSACVGYQEGNYMAQLKPPNNVKMTKMHYEWLAWSIRQVYARSHGWDLESIDAKVDLQNLAEKWADECKGTNPAFNRDRFISAVVNGRW